jgi:hypothetical protein
MDREYARRIPLVPAYVLWLIREKRVKTVSDILENYGITKLKELRSSRYYTYAHKIGCIIESLVFTGLIQQNGDSLEATDLVQQIQNILDVSLLDITAINSGGVVVNPFFPDKYGRVGYDMPTVGIFVLMPFLRDLLPVYEDHIKKVAQQLNLSVARADDFFNVSAIIDDIWWGINSSKILIADCTGRNPNVFYEIGIAHTLGKPVVLIAQDIGDIPFDLRHLRCLQYKLTPRGMKNFEKILLKTLTTELHNLGVETPTTA